MFLQTENFLLPREVAAIAEIARQASQVDSADTKILAPSLLCNAASVRMWSR
jgi:hypothetical protein